MGVKEDHELQTQTQHQPELPSNFPPAPYEQTNLRPVPSRLGPPPSIWPESSRLPGTKNTQPQDLRESLNDNLPTSTHNDDAPPTRVATPDTPAYFSSIPFLNTTIPSSSSQTRLIGWNSFPPQSTPDIDSVQPTTSPIEELPDIEKFTDKHIQQSVAFQEWVKQVNDERRSLRNVKVDVDKLRQLKIYREAFVQAPNERVRLLAQIKMEDTEQSISPDYIANIQKDRLLRAETEEVYSALVSVERCEAHAAARRAAPEILQRQQQHAQRELSGAERLLGSDGSLPPIPSLSKDNQLYFLDYPLKLCKMPFDEAVAAGLENIGPQNPPPQSLPNMFQPTSSPQSRGYMPTTSSLPESSSKSPRDPNIPDWFPLLTMRLEGRNAEARWRNLLNRIHALEKASERQSADEAAKKPKWDKEWHDPSPKWRHPHQRTHGGWWKCRTGPDALEAEKHCRVCHPRNELKLEETTVGPREQLRKINEAIAKAMAKVAEKDKAAALEMIRKERQENQRPKCTLSEEELRRCVCGASEEGVYQRELGYSLLRGHPD